MRTNKFLGRLFIILYWLISINVMTLIVRSGVFAFIELSKTPVDYENNPLIRYWFSATQFLESNIFAILYSFLFILIEELSEKWGLQRKSFARIILINSGIYLLGFISIFGFIGFVVTVSGLIPNEVADIPFTKEVAMMLTSFLVLLVFLTLLLNFIVQAVKNMGTYNLLRFVTGRYGTPVVEDRTFMFLDLVGSTTHAERMGYMLYSSLLKDCFHDINTMLPKYNAEVYQYVGDEIIITWKTTDALDNMNFIRIFFAIENMFEKRKQYYLDKYSVLPVFRAGCNCGRVTVTEVGVIKRDIAFHGDVLNTAARIQAMCKDLERDILISGHLKQQIGNIYATRYEFELLGTHQLRGKESRVDVFGVVNKNSEQQSELRVVS